MSAVFGPESPEYPELMLAADGVLAAGIRRGWLRPPGFCGCGYFYSRKYIAILHRMERDAGLRL